MGDQIAIYALRRKRAHLAGEIEQAQRAIQKQRATLATLDAVIRLFEPVSNPELIAPIRPRAKGDPLFRMGELTRLVLAALREAEKPIRVGHINGYILAAKGLEEADHRVKTRIAEKVRGALKRMSRGGTVRKIVDWPEMWWELAS